MTIEQRNHHSITSNVSNWKEVRPDLTYTCPDYCSYSHDLVSTLPPQNYSRATMKVIDYIYIDILP